MTTETTDSIRTHGLNSKAALTIFAIIGLGIAAEKTGIEWMHWFPDDEWAFVPRLFRPTPLVADPVIEGTVDDADLLGMVPEGPAAPLPPMNQPDPKLMSVVVLAAPPNASVPKVPKEEEGKDDEVPPGMAEAAASWAPPEGEGGYSEEDPEVISQFFESDANLPAPPPLRTTKAGLPLLAIEDPQRSLHRFYGSLKRVQDKKFGAVARVLHYGDSLITGDYVTQTVRRLMQTRFGDAGHGFVLAGRPAPWYRRANLDLDSSKNWTINRMTKPTISDQAYGLGAVTFRTTSAGEWLSLKPTGEDLGKSFSKMEVYYYGQPRGGKFEMGINGRMVEVNTRTEKPTSRKAEIQMNDGPHEFKLTTKGNGEVRLFGVALERDGPGVIYDSLGLDGARASLLKRMNPEHWHDQIRLRKPDVLLIHYGTNESQAEQLNIKRYADDLSQTVGVLRMALPGVSCLIVAPMDRADKDDKGKLTTRPVVKRIVLAQRRVAYEQGCAFWNTWRAMGGENSMAAWYKKGLGGGDLTHPTRGGARRIGSMLFAALMDGYAQWLKTQ